MLRAGYFDDLLAKKKYWDAIQVVKKYGSSSPTWFGEMLWDDAWNRADRSLSATILEEDSRVESLHELDPNWPDGLPVKIEDDDPSCRGKFIADWWEPRFLGEFLDIFANERDALTLYCAAETLGSLLAQRGELDSIIKVLECYDERLGQIREMVRKYRELPIDQRSEDDPLERQSLKDIDEEYQINYLDIVNDLVDSGYLDEAVKFAEYKKTDTPVVDPLDTSDYDANEILAQGFLKAKRFDEAWFWIHKYVNLRERTHAILDYSNAIAAVGRIDDALAIIDDFTYASQRSWAMFEASESLKEAGKIAESQNMLARAVDAAKFIKDPKAKAAQLEVYADPVEAAKKRDVGSVCDGTVIIGPYPGDPFYGKNQPFFYHGGVNQTTKILETFGRRIDEFPENERHLLETEFIKMRLAIYGYDILPLAVSSKEELPQLAQERARAGDYDETLAVLRLAGDTNMAKKATLTLFEQGELGGAIRVLRKLDNLNLQKLFEALTAIELADSPDKRTETEDSLRKISDPAVRAWTRYHAALRNRSTEKETAKSLLFDAAKDADVIADPETKSILLRAIAKTLFEEEEHIAAAGFLEQSLAASRRIGDEFRKGKQFAKLYVIWYKYCDLKDTYSYFHDGSEYLMENDALTPQQRSVIAEDCERFDKAIQFVAESPDDPQRAERIAALLRKYGEWATDGNPASIGDSELDTAVFF